VTHLCQCASNTARILCASAPLESAGLRSDAPSPLCAALTQSKAFVQTLKFYTAEWRSVASLDRIAAVAH
jgi:hypothetical protein